MPAVWPRRVARALLANPRSQSVATAEPASSRERPPARADFPGISPDPSGSKQGDTLPHVVEARTRMVEHPKRRPLRVEPLEDRAVPAATTVEIARARAL